jgi:cytoskeletal protein RodZ
MTRTRRKIHDLALLGLVGLAAALAGCATVPPPIQMMDRAQSEIRAARSAGAATAAPEALAEAERRLAAAQQFSTKDDNGKAADKAAEAEAAAATARARAEASRLGEQIQQQSSVNASLQADLERRQAAAAAAQQAAVAPPAPASTSAPAPGSSSAPPPSGLGPVTLPSIQLDQPGVPASSGSAGAPASAGTSGNPDSGVNP